MNWRKNNELKKIVSHNLFVKSNSRIPSLHNEHAHRLWFIINYLDMLIVYKHKKKCCALGDSLRFRSYCYRFNIASWICLLSEKPNKTCANLDDTRYLNSRPTSMDWSHRWFWARKNIHQHKQLYPNTRSRNSLPKIIANKLPKPKQQKEEIL